ncbi:hypothetical protein LTR08_004024 [Meristemomyces frigidus]|nr:hypothetical protein LTR08_004024 [Meristemomyces frigidus]
MAKAPAMTRSPSTASSALSNIDVQAEHAGGATAASTPPTSLAESASLLGSGQVRKLPALREEESGRRPKRARSGPSSYNVKMLSDAQLPATAGSSRNVSGLTGRTLVAGQEDEDEAGEERTPFGSKVDKAMDMDWELGPAARTTPKELPPRPLRRPSVKDRVKRVAGTVGAVLGKRGRGVFEAGKRKLGRAPAEEADGEEGEEEEEVPRWKKKLDMGAKGLLDEMDLDADVAEPLPPPAKKARLSGKAPLQEIVQPSAASVPVAKASAVGKKVKKWQDVGLYVGQDPDLDPTVPGGRKKLQKKRPDSSASDAPSTIIATATATATVTSNNPSFMNLPMFSYLEKDRNFTIPFDVFAPSFKRGDEKPKDWHPRNKNRLVGDARELWERSTEKLPPSMCVCRAPPEGKDHGCDDHCLNRVMQYECNDDNCNLPAAQCGNRCFAELTTRMKKGGPFDVGVEVVKTDTRGFGVRSCRGFAVGQVIMEYTGEIISEGECQRRMREDYKDMQCYYLMELERGLIIDGTKGSMARFINHSCEPNCEVRMVKVNGTARMGVFAGDQGIVTGEELTYDYNFDNFGTRRQECFCGAASCRGFLSKRLNAAEVKRAAKVEGERKRVAAVEARRHAEEEARKKVVKGGRGSGWRGWVAVDDPEMKERLRAEKREREEADRGSSRAKRLAARRGSLPAAGDAGGEAMVGDKGEVRRRRTVHGMKEAGPSAEVDEDAAAAAVPQDEPSATVSPQQTAPAHAHSPVGVGVTHDDTVTVSAQQKTLSCASLARAPSTASSVRAPSRPTSAISALSAARRAKVSIAGNYSVSGAGSSTVTNTNEEHEVQGQGQGQSEGEGEGEGEGEEVIVASQKRSKRRQPLVEAAKSVGRAVKNAGLNVKATAGGKGAEGKVREEGRKGMKQSTLAFSRLA